MVAQWTVNGVDQNNISNELVIPSLTGKTDVTVKFVPYKGFAIPTGDTGWKVSDVKRVPDDTQPTSEIRKNGELTFTVTPEGEKLFRKLIGQRRGLSGTADNRRCHRSEERRVLHDHHQGRNKQHCG